MTSQPTSSTHQHHTVFNQGDMSRGTTVPGKRLWPPTWGVIQTTMYRLNTNLIQHSHAHSHMAWSIVINTLQSTNWHAQHFVAQTQNQTKPTRLEKGRENLTIALNSRSKTDQLQFEMFIKFISSAHFMALSVWHQQWLISQDGVGMIMNPPQRNVNDPW